MSEIVECRSDYTYAQTPLALVWHGQRLEILQILEQWRSPTGINFRVLTTEQQIFTLTYLEADDFWSIETNETAQQE